MKKIVSIVGARPQFIKAAVVSREIRSRRNFSEMIIHTGQHFDKNMSELFFEELQIPKPDLNLGIHSKSEAAMTGEMIISLEKALMEVNPDLVLVFGDTTSTLAGAIAAQKSGFKIGHVEAGLRSFNREMPEETNRVLTDRISDLLFCPTENAVNNLRKEHFDPAVQKIVLTGDVMLDAFQFYSRLNKDKTQPNIQGILEKGEFVLCTLHRQSNVDDDNQLRLIISQLATLSKKVNVVFPCHPRTRKKMKSLPVAKGITLIDPVGYLDMIALLHNCKLIITDSGGLQKEAYFAGKYCITLREETEWVELVDNGFNFLLGENINELEKFYNEVSAKEWRSDIKLYGSGNASQLILDEIERFLN